MIPHSRKQQQKAVTERARSQETKAGVLHTVEPPPLLLACEMGGCDHALEIAWQAQSKQAEALVAKTAEVLRANDVRARKIGQATQK